MSPAIAVAFLVFAAWCALLLLQDHVQLAHASPWHVHRLDVAFSEGSGEGPPGLTEAQRAALREICGPKLQKDLRQWLKSLCVATADLEDVAQAVTTAAIRSLPTYDPARGTPRVWLNQIALSTASNRNAYLRRRAAETLEDADCEDEREGAEDALLAEEERAGLVAAVHELPATQRAVLVGHDLDGVSMNAIARTCGIPVSTLYKRRLAGLSMLRELLKRL